MSVTGAPDARSQIRLTPTTTYQGSQREDMGRPTPAGEGGSKIFATI